MTGIESITKKLLEKPDVPINMDELKDIKELPTDLESGQKQIIDSPDIPFIERTSRSALLEQRAFEVSETKSEGLTEEERTKIKEENGWCDEVVDKIQNMEQYEILKDGGLIENEINGHECLIKEKIETDDDGNVYCVDGKLQPQITYELNGNTYTTDENGRIISCEAKPVRSPENPRDNEAQRQAGGEDRRPNDQGGHIVGRDMNGDGGIGNLVAMDSKINQSDYKRMENNIKATLDEGKDVTTKTELTYSGDSERPDKITVVVTVDGKDTVYKFDNNLDGALRDEVSENGKEMVQDRVDETGGEISSIKEEYDEDGNPIETTVYITYKGENGVNYRTSVVIENQ